MRRPWRGAYGPYCTCPRPGGRAALADPGPPLRGSAADQAPARRRAQPHRGQSLPPLEPAPPLQRSEQDLLDDGPHLALERRARSSVQPGDPAPLRQAGEAVSQRRPLIQPIDAVDDLPAVQAPCAACLIALGHLPTPPFRQMRHALFPALGYGLPPLLCAVNPALEESKLKSRAALILELQTRTQTPTQVKRRSICRGNLLQWEADIAA
jgi:hypothetical protein